MMLTRRLLAAFGAVLLAGCTAASLPQPAVIADRTVLDEEAVLKAERLYQAAATVALAAARTGIIPAAARPAVAAADRRAYAALLAMRAAYGAGNARRYSDAGDEADAAIKHLLRAIRG